MTVSGAVSLLVAALVVVSWSSLPEMKPMPEPGTLSNTSQRPTGRTATGTLYLENYRFKGDTQAIRCWQDPGKEVKCGAATSTLKPYSAILTTT